MSIFSSDTDCLSMIQPIAHATRNNIAKVKLNHGYQLSDFLNEIKRIIQKFEKKNKKKTSQSGKVTEKWRKVTF